MPLAPWPVGCRAAGSSAWPALHPMQLIFGSHANKETRVQNNMPFVLLPCLMCETPVYCRETGVLRSFVIVVHCLHLVSYLNIAWGVPPSRPFTTCRAPALPPK